MTRTDTDMTRTDTDSGRPSGSGYDPDTDRYSPKGESVLSGSSRPDSGVRRHPSATTPGNCPGQPPLDFARLAEGADLPAMLAAEGIDVRRGMALCPFHDNTRTPALSIYRHEGRWRFKCHGCDAKGDALDWVRLRDNVDAITAARSLDPLAEAGVKKMARPEPRPAPAPRPPARWQSLDWQQAVDDLVVAAEACLWSAAGAAVRAWLHARGLADHTIHGFRLGYLPAAGWTAPVRWPNGTVAGIRHERGVLFPWLAPESWYSAWDKPAPVPRWVGANIRRLAADPFAPLTDDPKFQALTGSERGHGYPYPTIEATQGAVPALIVEGEPDALLGFQELGHIVHVLTVGSASVRPASLPRPTLAALARCPWLLLAFDHDAAGVEAARHWRDFAPHKARRLLLPAGKDLGEYHVGGGDVVPWLRGELARLGIKA